MSRGDSRRRADSYAGKRVARKPSRKEARESRRGPAPGAPGDGQAQPLPGARSAVPLATPRPTPRVTSHVSPQASRPEEPTTEVPKLTSAEEPWVSRRSSRFRAVLHHLSFTTWLVVVAAGVTALVAALTGHVEDGVGEAGAIATSTAYTWGFAARTGGRPVVFSLLTLILGGVVVAVDSDPLRSGAAVVTAVLTAVFAVMATVPAVHFIGAVRENLVALVLAAVGSMATLAWAPVVDLHRFEYTVLGLSLVAAFMSVHRLGAGFHGLGTRGILAVLGGSLMLALTLGYAELLQHYGSHGLVETLDDAVRWSHHHLGAFPRPIIALLGVPALTWGTHMRARRRQGWWVCAFGVAMTAPVAYGLVDPGRSVEQVALATAYAGAIGLAIGYLLIRLDLRLTGPRGRRLAETEAATAVRPEPGRTHALW